MKTPAFWKLIFAMILAASAFGCASKEPAGPDASPSATASPGDAKEAANGDKEPLAEPKLSDLPAILKHEGYQYSGLEIAETVEYELLQKPQMTTPEPATQITKLAALEDNLARFHTERTGTLGGFGADEVEVRPDGIYHVKMAGNPLEPPMLELPAELPVGKTWTSKGSVKTADGRSVELNMAFRVIGPESVKTKAGTFQALKIVGKGTVKGGGESIQTTATHWYVKGKGNLLMDSRNSKGTMRMEVTKLP